MTEQNDDDFLGSLGDADDFIEYPEVDPLIMNPMLLTAKTFENDKPPDLIKLAGDSNELRDIAIKLKKLFDTEGFVKYSKENRTDLEFIVRTFAYQVSKLAQQSVAPIANVSQPAQNKTQQTNPKEKAVISMEDFQKLTRELLKAQQEAAELDGRFKISERTKEALRNELKQTREENNNMAQKIAELNHNLSKERSSYDNMIQNLKKENGQVQDSERETKDKLSMSEFNVSRLQRQIDELNKELANEKSNNVVTRSKIEASAIKVANFKEQLHAQSSELHHLEAENEDLKTQNGELMSKIESMSKELYELNPENLTAQKTENERIAKALLQITNLCQSQSEEINQLYKNRTDAMNLIQKQNDLIGTLTDELTKTQSTLQQNQEQVLSASFGSPIREREVLVESPPSPKTYKSQTIIERDTMEPIRDLLRDDYGELDNQSALEVVQQLLKNKTAKDESNFTPELLNIIENQLRFISNLSRSGEIQLFLLSSPEANETILESKSFKNDIAVEIARCRQFLSEHNLIPDNQLPPIDMAQKELDSYNNSTTDRKNFDIAAFSALTAEVVRRLSESIIEQNDQLTASVKEASEIVKFEGEPLEALQKIIQILKSSRVFTKNSKDIIEFEGDYNDLEASYAQILQFITQSKGIVTRVDTELREIINFDGPLEDVPTRATQLIEKIQNDFDNLQVSTVEEMKNQLAAAEEELQNEKETSTNVISNLEIQLNQKSQELSEAEDRYKHAQNEIIDLKDSLSDTKQNLQSTENKLNLLQSTHNDLQDEMTRVRDENEQLHKDQVERQQRYDERVTQLINLEKQQHDADVEQLTEKYKQREEKLQQNLDRKTQKLQEAKQTLKQLIAEYDTAFRKQKDTTAALRMQNQALMSKIKEGVTVSGRSNRDGKANEGALTTQVKGLQAEKDILLGRIDQLEKRVEQAQSARDAYWQSQVAMKDVEMENVKKEMEEVAKERLDSYVSKLAAVLEQFAPSDFDGTDEQVFELVERIGEKLEDSESQIIALKRKVATQQAQLNKDENPSEKVSKAVAAIKSVSEWEKWAKSLIQNVAREIPPGDEASMRKRLSDLCIAGSASKSAEVITSLRAQKAAFVSGAAAAKQSAQSSSKSLFLASWFAVKMSRELGQNTSIVAPNSRSFVSFN